MAVIHPLNLRYDRTLEQLGIRGCAWCEDDVPPAPVAVVHVPLIRNNHGTKTITGYVWAYACAKHLVWQPWEVNGDLAP